MSERQPSARCGSFDEVALGLTETQVFTEAARCLQCGVCSECLQCVEACVSSETIQHGAADSVDVEHAGVVIIADPQAAPSVKG
jgi:hypothetical protein